MSNYIEVLLKNTHFTKEYLVDLNNPKYLIGTKDENINDFLDKIAAIQIISQKIKPDLPISLINISRILARQFECTTTLKISNADNLNKTIKILNADNLKNDLRDIDITSDVIFEIELQDIWKYYSIEKNEKHLLNKYLDSTKLYEEIKRIINPEYTLEYYLNMNKNVQKETNGFILGVHGDKRSISFINFKNNKEIIFNELDSNKS